MLQKRIAVIDYRQWMIARETKHGDNQRFADAIGKLKLSTWLSFERCTLSAVVGESGSNRAVPVLEDINDLL